MRRHLQSSMAAARRPNPRVVWGIKEPMALLDLRYHARMRLRLSTTFPVLSLALCVATLALWAWDWCSSHNSPPTGFRFPLPVGGDAEEWLTIRSGRIEVWEYTSWDRTWYRISDRGFPLWCLPAGLLALHVGLSRLSHWTFRAGRSPATGLCRSCGYDLRATPDRCPECGTFARHD